METFLAAFYWPLIIVGAIIAFIAVLRGCFKWNKKDGFEFKGYFRK